MGQARVGDQLRGEGVMDRVTVSNPVVGLLHMQVCAEPDVTDAEILEVANRENPSGTSHGWGYIEREGKLGPVPCTAKESNGRVRVHFLVGC